MTSFSISVDDPNSLQTASLGAITAAAETAAARWAHYLWGTGSIEVQVNIVDALGGGAIADGRSAVSVAAGTDGAYQLYDQGAAFEINTGFDPNLDAPDIIINLSAAFLASGSIYLGSDPVVPQNQYDAVTILEHEIGHGLAFNGWRDAVTGALPGAYESPFDAAVVNDGTDHLYFTGAHAEAVHGGPVLLSAASYGHLDGPDLMDPYVDAGLRRPIGDLDIAIAQDTGLSISSERADPLVAGMAGLTIHGWGGNDTLVAAAGGDAMYGDDGADSLAGGTGDDWMEGGAGADTLVGHTGLDTVSYAGSSAGVTIILESGTAIGGDAQGDVIGAFANLMGSAHADRITGSIDPNLLQGGAGADTLLAFGGSDTLDGGTGSDWTSLALSGAAVSVSLETGANAGGMAEGLVLHDIENVYGSRFNDVLTGDANANLLAGAWGADTLVGVGGNDAADYEFAGSGVTVNLATNVNLGGEAQGDLLIGLENLYGSGYRDRLTGDDAANYIQGKGGDDTIDGGAGSDTLVGGSGLDVYLFDRGHGQDVVQNAAGGGAATGELWFGSSIATNDLWLRHVGDDLEIDVMGGSDHVTVDGWYTSADAQLQALLTGSGSKLDARLDNLVAEMARFEMDNPGFDPTAPDSAGWVTDQKLLATIIDAWHP